jgi:hypothetical protein
MAKNCFLSVEPVSVKRFLKKSGMFAEVPYLVLDARYEKVHHAGSVVSCVVMVAVGVDTEGRRTILGTSVSLSEAEPSLLRLVGALLMETDEDRQTGKRYIDMNVENDTPALQQKKIKEKMLPESPHKVKLYSCASRREAYYVAWVWLIPMPIRGCFTC